MNTYDGIYFSHPPTGKQAAADIYQNQWTDKYCYARAWCGGFATSKMFATAEQQAMFATTKTNESYKPKDNALWLACGNDAGSISNGALSGDKAFYLSAEEYENTNYGLAEDKKTGYMLRSSSSASFVTEGQTIYNGVGILATPGFLPSRIYWKEYSGNTFTFTETAFDKWFTIFDFFGSVSEETYNYVYATHTARPAMNLDANKVL